MTKRRDPARPSEADLERAARDFLALDGWRCFHLEPNFSERKLKAVAERGMPDVLAIRYGYGAKPGHAPSDALVELMWIEWKSPQGRAAIHQLAWHAREQARGALALIAGVDFPASLEAFIDLYQKSGLQRHHAHRSQPAAARQLSLQLCAPSLACPES